MEDKEEQINNDQAFKELVHKEDQQEHQLEVLKDQEEQLEALKDQEEQLEVHNDQDYNKEEFKLLDKVDQMEELDLLQLELIDKVLQTEPHSKQDALHF